MLLLERLISSLLNCLLAVLLSRCFVFSFYCETTKSGYAFWMRLSHAGAVEFLGLPFVLGGVAISWSVHFRNLTRFRPNSIEQMDCLIAINDGQFGDTQLVFDQNINQMLELVHCILRTTKSRLIHPVRVATGACCHWANNSFPNLQSLTYRPPGLTAVFQSETNVKMTCAGRCDPSSIMISKGPLDFTVSMVARLD